MTTIGIALLLFLLLAIIGYQWRLVRQARKFEGALVSDLPVDVDAILRERGKVLLYFYSPSCGPCRSMTPVIDRMTASRDNVFKFDVAQTLDLARKLGVMATPTFILVADNRIARVNLGAMTEKRLIELLE